MNNDPWGMRPDLVAMQGYVSPSLPLELLAQELGRPLDQIIKLDTNENPFGAPPKVCEALQHLGRELSVYPEVEMSLLRRDLENYVGVPMEHILVGSGSDEILTMIERLFLTTDDCIVDCPPTFTVYSLNAYWIGAKVIKVDRSKIDFSLDVEAIEKAVLEHRPKLLFLCHPNNPDGSLIPHEVIARLLKLPVVVVVDEAYQEFTGEPSWATEVPHTPNLIVLRTFSKWAGLAGLRVGYGIFPLHIIEHLWKIKQPFNVNVAADVAARAALQDIPVLQENARIIIAERERLYRQLQTIDYLKPFPSRANFLFAAVERVPVQTIMLELRQRGILIRHYERPGIEAFIRITVGKPSDNDAVLAALREIGVVYA